MRLADEASCLGPAERQPYQNIALLVNMAKLANVDAVHPGGCFRMCIQGLRLTSLGYGYLSENAEFARAVATAGLVFIGPTPEAISKLGDKVCRPSREPPSV